MTETERLTPALTPEEWAARECNRGWYRLAISQYGEIVVGDVDTDRIAVHPTANAALALIALANHALPNGDPRKLTWEMVDAVDVAAQMCLNSDVWAYPDEETAHTLRALAAALRSLLPARREAAGG